MSGIDEIVSRVALAACDQVASRLLADLEERIQIAVERALERARTNQVIDTAGLADLLGCPTLTAAKRRADRDPELRALALTGGGGKRWTWRRHEVEALLSRRRGERKGRC